EVRIIFPDSGIHGDTKTSGLYGIFGAVVASSREKNFAEAIKPLAESLQTYNIPNKTKDIYKARMNKVSWMKVKKWNVDFIKYPEYRKMTKASKHDAVLFIETKYFLSTDFKKLKVYAKSNMYINNGNNTEPRKVFSLMDDYLYDMTKHSGGEFDRAKLASKWSENNAKIIKEKIIKAINIQANYLLKNLDPPKNQKEESFWERFTGKNKNVRE
ncbi:MAG: hypothetical protein OEX07_17160, partial [Gammaproteobacteria bacterium]|nr:hypothetical protein [Gammaproteobacteria bacterium]